MCYIFAVKNNGTIDTTTLSSNKIKHMKHKYIMTGGINTKKF